MKNTLKMSVVLLSCLFCGGLAAAAAEKIAAKSTPETGSLAEKKKDMEWNFTPDEKLPNVLILGDSISIGYTLDVRKLLAGKANVYRPMAKDGRTAENCSGTTNGVKNIDRWLGDRKWAVIHFNWGLHDLKHVTKDKGTPSALATDPVQATVEQYSTNLEMIVRKLEATGAKLIFATTTPVPAGCNNPLREPEAPVRYNEAALAIMKAHRIPVNDLYAFALPQLAKFQLPRNVHFSATGSRQLAAQVVQSIKLQLFADSPLSRKDAEKAQDLLWQDYVSSARKAYDADWQAKRFAIDNLTMKFDYRTFGEKPAAGWDLYISMHGGGGCPAEINESQWKNQINLYKPTQGIYLAPRAPTDNWNLWHEGHIDGFFDRLIQSGVISMNINPNRVYLMGYSAGGDGVYQMAPRMADRWAAAAMMSGHPNDANPLNLRNIGFTLHAGELDAAYGRNKVSAQWKDMLAKLHTEDPGGYINECVIHKGLGHWMNLEDAVAVPWMAKFTRQPYPDKVVWKRTDLRKTSSYWLALPDDQKVGGAEMVVQRNGQEITILRCSGIDKLTLRFNDKMLNLDQPVKVLHNGKIIFKGVLPRTAALLTSTLQNRKDRDLMFCSEITVPVSDSSKPAH